MAALSPAPGGATSTAFVLLGLMLVGDEGEAELVREPGNRLAIVADDEAVWARDFCTQPTILAKRCRPCVTSAEKCDHPAPS